MTSSDFRGVKLTLSILFATVFYKRCFERLKEHCHTCSRMEFAWMNNLVKLFSYARSTILSQVSFAIIMTQLGRVLFTRARSTLGFTSSIAGRCEKPVIKFPAAFNNIKKVKKMLRYENSVYFAQLNSKSKSRPKRENEIVNH